MSKGKYYFSKSLEKGLKILALFNRETPVLSQSAVARTLGLNMTSTYRYINTLVELGYLEKDPRTREIRPSILCLLLCTNLMRAADHRRMIQKAVDDLHGTHNISVEVAFVVGNSLVCLYQKEAQETLTYSLPDQTHNCLHNTALGKAYLSSLPDEEMAAKIDGMDLVARTARTIVDRNTLFEELEKTRAHGYALSNEEYLEGLISIAAPLYDPIGGQAVGAVSFDFSVIQQTLREVEKAYAALITKTAVSLSALLPPNHVRR